MRTLFAKKQLCIKCGRCISEESNFCPNCGQRITKIDTSPKEQRSNPPKKQQSNPLKSHKKAIIITIIFICIIVPSILIINHYFEYDPQFFENIKVKWENWNTRNANNKVVADSNYSKALAITEDYPHVEAAPIPEPAVIKTPEPPKRVLLWKYEKDFDSFDSITREFCYTYSSDKQEKLLIRKQNGKTEVLLSSNYLFRSNYSDDYRVRLKFDSNKPYSNGYNDSTNLGGETIFLRHPEKIINRIKESNSLVIEYPSIMGGNLRATFSLHDYNEVCKF